MIITPSGEIAIACFSRTSKTAGCIVPSMHQVQRFSIQFHKDNTMYNRNISVYLCATQQIRHNSFDCNYHCSVLRPMEYTCTMHRGWGYVMTQIRRFFPCRATFAGTCTAVPRQHVLLIRRMENVFYEISKVVAYRLPALGRWGAIECRSVVQLETSAPGTQMCSVHQVA